MLRDQLRMLGDKIRYVMEHTQYLIDKSIS